MTGFKTKHNIYTVDTKRNLITGGVFGNKMIEFKSIVVLERNKSKIILKNGQVITTSTVEKVF